MVRGGENRFKGKGKGAGEGEREGKERGMEEMERERGGMVAEEVCSRNFQCMDSSTVQLTPISSFI